LCFGEAKVVNDRRIPSPYFADDAGYRTFLLAPPVYRFDGFVRQVDAFECFENMVDKTRATLFAVGQKVKTDLFLSPHVETRSVVLGFVEGGTLESKVHSTAICGPEPTGPWKAADAGRGDGRELHNITSEDFLWLYMR